MKLYFWLVTLMLAFALLYFIPLCSLPPRVKDEAVLWNYAVKVAVSGGVVAVLALALVIAWLRELRDHPK